MSAPTPAEVARYDQVLATVEHDLDVFIGIYRAGVDEGAKLGEIEAVNTAGFAAFLEDQVQPGIVAELLTAAIRRLSVGERSA